MDRKLKKQKTIAEIEAKLNFRKQVTSNSVDSIIYQLDIEDLKRIQPGSFVEIFNCRKYEVTEVQTFQKKPHIFVFNGSVRLSYKNDRLQECFRSSSDLNGTTNIRWFQTYWYDAILHLFKNQLHEANYAPKQRYTEDDIPTDFNDFHAMRRIHLTNLQPRENEVLDTLASIATADDDKLSILCPQLNELVCQYLYPQ